MLEEWFALTPCFRKGAKKEEEEDDDDDDDDLC